MIDYFIALARKHSEVIRYGIVGGLNTIFGLTLFWLLESVLGIQYLVANAVTWIVCIVLVFFANKYIVFKSNAKEKTVVEMLKFFVFRIAAGLVEMELLYIMVDMVSAPVFLSKCIVTIITIILNYITSKLIVFRVTANLRGNNL